MAKGDTEQQVQDPELRSGETSSSTMDLMQMAKMMAFSMLSQQSGMPFMTSQMPPLQNPFGGPGLMSIPQRPASQSLDLWSTMMHVPNALTGSNYPTKLQDGFYYPLPGMSAADVAQRAESYQSFAAFTQPISLQNSGQIKGIVDSVSQKLGFSPLTYDAATGRGSMFGQALDSPMLSTVVNQMATYLGAPSMEARNTIWEQRGMLGYNRALAEGVTRGMAPISSDTALATNFMNKLDDTFFERGKNGEINTLARRYENLQGFDPDQAYRIVGTALQGGAKLSTGSDVTKMLGAASAITSFTGNDAQGIQEAINSMARQGGFGQDTASLEKMTVNLRTMAKQLKELNVSQEVMKDVYDQAEKLAVMSTGGISTITGKPSGNTALLTSQIGLSSAMSSASIAERMPAMMASGQLSRNLTAAELGQYGSALSAKTMESEYYNAGQFLQASRYRTQMEGGDLSAIDASIETWRETANADPRRMQNMLVRWEQAAGGVGSLKRGSPAMQAIAADMERVFAKEGKEGYMTKYDLDRTTQGAISTDLKLQASQDRYRSRQVNFDRVRELEGGGGIKTSEVRSIGLNAAISELALTDPQGAAELKKVKDTEGDTAAHELYLNVYSKNSKVNQAFMDAQSDEYDARMAWTPDRAQQVAKSVRERFSQDPVYKDRPVALQNKINEEVKSAEASALASSADSTAYREMQHNAGMLGMDVVSGNVLSQGMAASASALDPKRMATATAAQRVAMIQEHWGMVDRFNPQLIVARGIGGSNMRSSEGWDQYLSDDEKTYINDRSILPAEQQERRRKVTENLTDKILNNYVTKVDGKEVFNFATHGAATGNRFKDKDGVLDIGALRSHLEQKGTKGFMETMSDSLSQTTGIDIPGMNPMADIKGFDFSTAKKGFQTVPSASSSTTDKKDNLAAKGNASKETVIVLKFDGMAMQGTLLAGGALKNLHQTDPHTLMVS